MSEWAITQTGRFKAAVAGAGVFDQQAEFETEDGPADDEWYFGTPWEHPDVFARNSPATYIGNAHTPTLIFDGEEDTVQPRRPVQRAVSRAQASGRRDRDGFVSGRGTFAAKRIVQYRHVRENPQLVRPLS